MPDEELTSPKVKLHKDGRLTQNQDGTDVTVATYNRTTGHLEFATKEASVKLYQQIVAKIGTVNKGTQPSGLTIKSFGVSGQDVAALKNAPKKPKMSQLGDCTPEVVEWYFNYNLPEFIIRYGVYTDAEGKPIRKKATRLVVKVADNRDMDDDDLDWVKDGKKSQTKGPVVQESERVTETNAIIARRATHMTFTPQEVIGGFAVDEDEDSVVVGEEGEE